MRCRMRGRGLTGGVARGYLRRLSRGMVRGGSWRIGAGAGDRQGAGGGAWGDDAGHEVRWHGATAAGLEMAGAAAV